MLVDTSNIYVSYGATESGDDLEILLWNGNPTYEMVIAAYKELYPDEFDEGVPFNFRVELGNWQGKVYEHY